MTDLLTGAQRRHLRGLAHHLRPLVQVGRGGLSEAIVQAIDEALLAHELIKVRIVTEREQRGEWVEEIERRLDCRSAGTVGHVVILYRPHPDPEKRRLSLPA